MAELKIGAGITNGLHHSIDIKGRIVYPCVTHILDHHYGYTQRI